MQNLNVRGAIAAGAVFVSGTACAQAAVLPPAREPATGLAWRCEGDPCAGSSSRPSAEEGLLRECRKVVAIVGPVSRYRSGARELSHAKVRVCNRSAAGSRALQY
jgi:hypothetical protein